MADDTLTLVLDGEVRLSDYETSVRRFKGLVEALSEDYAPQISIEWKVSALDYGSATMTVRGEVATNNEPQLQGVIRAYEEIGAALERGQILSYTERVRTEARGLVGLLDGRIREIRFETAQREAVITSKLRATEPLIATDSTTALTSYGAVVGRVQTLTSRGTLRFTLYDTIHDRAVSCYLAEGREDIMRGAWGHLATVEGQVRRDELSGRPLSIRGITNVEVIPEIDRDAYKQARGIVPRGNAPRAEEVIRRIRDA